MRACFPLGNARFPSELHLYFPKNMKISMPHIKSCQKRPGNNSEHSQSSIQAAQTAPEPPSIFGLSGGPFSESLWMDFSITLNHLPPLSALTSEVSSTFGPKRNPKMIRKRSGKDPEMTPGRDSWNGPTIRFPPRFPAGKCEARAFVAVFLCTGVR